MLRISAKTKKKDAMRELEQRLYNLRTKTDGIDKAINYVNGDRLSFDEEERNSLYDSAKRQVDRLNSLSALLQSNRDIYEEEYGKEYVDKLTKFASQGSTYGEIANRVKTKNDYASQFADENDYNNWQQYGGLTRPMLKTVSEKLENDYTNAKKSGNSAAMDSSKNSLAWVNSRIKSMTDVGSMSIEEMQNEYADVQKSSETLSSLNRQKQEIRKELSHKKNKGRGLSRGGSTEEKYQNMSIEELETELANLDSQIDLYGNSDVAYFDNDGNAITWDKAIDTKIRGSYKNMSLEEIEKKRKEAAAEVENSKTKILGITIPSGETTSAQSVYDAWESAYQVKKAEEYKKNPDWDEKSQMPDVTNEPSGIQDTFKIINGQKPKYDNDVVDGFWGVGFSDKVKQMTPEQVAACNYIYNTTKDMMQVRAYIDGISAELNKKVYDEEVTRESNLSGGGLAWENVKSVAENTVGGVPAAVNSVASHLMGKPIDPYDPAYKAINSADITRAETSRRIQDNIGGVGGDVVDFLYGTAMSGLDSAATIPINMIIPGSGLVIMGSRAGVSATNEAIKKGISQDKAMLTGLMAGGFEAAFEKIPLDRLTDVLKNGRKATSGLFKTLLKEGGINAGEEFLTTLSTEMADRMINGDLSNYAVNIEKYRLEGLPTEEARKKANTDFALQLAQDAAAGFLQGFSMTAGASAVNTAYNKSVGGNIADKKNVGVLVEKAKALKGSEELNGLIAEVEGFDNEKLSGKQKATIGKLYNLALNEAQQQLTDGTASENKIKSAIVSRLTELKSQNIGATADAIVKNINGEKLSKEESNTISNNPVAQRVISEIENAGSQDYTSDWASDVIADTMTERSAGVKAFQEIQNLANATSENVVTGQQKAKASGIAVNPQNIDTYTEGEKVIGSAVKSLKTAQNGNILVEFENGSTKALSDVELSETSAEVVAYAKDYGEYANIFLQTYKQGTTESVDAFAKEFNYAYESGKIGATLDYVQNSDYTKSLTPTQIQNAWEVGRQMSEAEARSGSVATYEEYQANKKAGKVTVDKSINTKRLNHNQISAMYAIRGIARATGINIVLENKGLVRDTNGAYDPNTNTIHIDINAGKYGLNFGEYAMLRTLSHELTHYIRYNNKAAYKQLQDFIFSKLSDYKGKSIDELVAAEQYGDMNFEDAAEEVVARACEMMLRDSVAIEALYNENRGLFNTIKNFIADFKKAVYRAFDRVGARSEAAKAMLGYTDELQTLWDNALVGAVHNQQGKGTVAQGEQNIAVGVDGKPVDAERITSDEKNFKYSITHNDEIAAGQEEYISKPNYKGFVNSTELQRAHELTKAMVNVMIKYSSILPTEKFDKKVLTKNGSYDISVENTTICIRTLAYNEFVDKVQEEIGRPLSQMESFLVSQKLYDIAVDPQCLYCYVSLDRKAFNEMLLRYMSERDTVIEKYKKSDKTKNTVAELYKEFLHGRKDTDNMKKRFNKWISYVDNDVQLLSLADVATEERQSQLKGTLAEQMKDARKYAQSASWAKIQKNYVAYRDEILKLNERVVKNLNEHYGLRWYSFSDYSAAFIVENMQQITDAAIRGLKGLAYTKDTDFVEIFAPSGMNINVSVFVNKDKNGNFYIDERQSANLEKAKELRGKYPNVGIVATVTDDEAIKWAGEQDWSDVIIPFHIVRTGADVAEYYKWLNYTSESGDKVKDSDLWQAYLDSLNLKSDSARKKVSKNVYPNEHNNDKTTYLELCEKRGLTPRFVRFAGESWYMKLVNETRLSAENSTVLQPEFDIGAAEKSFQKFIEKGGYEGGWYKEGVDVDREVKQVASDVLAGKKANEVDYGRQDGYSPEQLISNRKSNRIHAGDKVIKNERAEITEDEVISQSKKAMAAELTRLRELLKMQGKESHGTVFTKSSVDLVAAELIREADSGLTKAELAPLLNKLYARIASDKELNFEDVMDEAREIADKINEQARLRKFQDPRKQEIKEYIRKNSIYISKEALAEGRAHFGGAKEFANAWRGKIKFTTTDKSAMPIDTLWREAQGLYGEYFDSEVFREPEMAYKLVEIYNQLNEDATADFSDYYSDEIREQTAYDIYDGFWRVNTLHTVADKYAKEMRQLKSAHKTRLEKLRAESEQTIKDLKSGNREKIKSVYEKRDKANEIRSISKKANALYKKLKDNSAKSHIPEPLKKPLGDFLMNLDFSSNSMLDNAAPTLADAKFSERLSALNNILKNYAGDTAKVLDIRDETTSELDELYNDITKKLPKGESFTINKMTVAELKTLRKFLTEISKAITNADKALAEVTTQRISELGYETIDDLKDMKTYQPFSNKKLKNTSTITKWDMKIPFYAFKLYGRGGKTIFKGLMNGWGNFARNVKAITDFADGVYTEKEVQNWKSNVQTYKLSDGDLQMTDAIAMYLYVAVKREQARKHLFGAGLAIEEFEQKGKSRNVVQKGQHFSIEDIAEIESHLTERQKEVANKLQQFMGEKCAEWGNVVSMKRHGIKIFTEKNYIPIKTLEGGDAISDKDADRSLYRLLNLSFTKATNINANNSLVARDIFDVFTEHTTDMAKYNALALPVLDAVRWANFQETTESDTGEININSVKKSLDNAYGKDAMDYIDKFLKSLSGVKDGGVSRVEKFLTGFFKNFKIAAVAANLRVAFLQLSSYVRAGAVLSQKSLNVANFKKLPSADLVNRYSGMALWKSMGYFDINVARGVREQIAKQSKVKDKIIEKSMWLTSKADEYTLRKLWTACEYEISKQNPKLKKGSEEYNKAVGEKLDEVIMATQVVDSTITRAPIMRERSATMQQMVAFMSEPLVTLNVMTDGFLQMQNDVRKGMPKAQAVKKHFSTLMKLSAIFFSQAVVVSLLESLWDAWRDDDDDEYILKFLRALPNNLYENANILNQVPVLNDFLEGLENTLILPYADELGVKETAELIFGKDYSQNAKAEFSQFYYDIKDAAKKWSKIASGESDNYYGAVYKTATALSRTSGLPFSNVLREGVSLYNNIVDFMGKEDLKFRTYEPTTADMWDSFERNFENKDTTKMKKVVDDMLNEKTEKYISEGATKQEAKAKALTSVRSSFTRRYKKLYQEAYKAKDTKECARIYRLAQSSKLYPNTQATISGWKQTD